MNSEPSYTQRVLLKDLTSIKNRIEQSKMELCLYDAETEEMIKKSPDSTTTKELRDAYRHKLVGHVKIAEHDFNYCKKSFRDATIIKYNIDTEVESLLKRFNLEK